MKLVAVLMVCSVAAAAPNLAAEQVQVASVGSSNSAVDLAAPVDLDNARDGRNLLINIFVNQVIAYLRRVINNGSDLLGIPPLDPLDLEHFHVQVPAGIINLDLELHDLHAAGFGGFVMHTSRLNIRQLTFDMDVSFPAINIRAGGYDLVGDLFTAIPLFGKGEAHFTMEGFRLKALLHLKQSDDGQSVLLDRIENTSFELPHFKVHLTGVIGGGDIDSIVNSMVEEVIVDYVRRFQGAISAYGSNLAVTTLNPILDQFDTWRYLAPFTA